MLRASILTAFGSVLIFLIFLSLHGKCESAQSIGGVDIYRRVLSTQGLRLLSTSSSIIFLTGGVLISFVSGGTINGKLNPIVMANLDENETPEVSGSEERTLLSTSNSNSSTGTRPSRSGNGATGTSSFPPEDSHLNSNYELLSGNRNRNQRLISTRVELLKQIKSLDHLKCFPKVLCGLSVDSSKTSKALDSYFVKSYIQLMRSANPDNDSSEETKPSEDREKDALSLFLMKSGLLKSKKSRTSQSASSSEEEEDAMSVELQPEVYKSSIEKKNEALKKFLLSKRKLDTGDWNFSNKSDLHNMKDQEQSDLFKFVRKRPTEESSSVTSQIGSLVSSWVPWVSVSFGTDSFEKDPFFKGGGGGTTVVKQANNFNEEKWQKDLDKLATLMKLRELEIREEKIKLKELRNPRIGDDEEEFEEYDDDDADKNTKISHRQARARDLALGIVDDEMQVYSTAVEIGKKLKDTRQCDYLYNGCPVPYAEIIKIISTIRKEIKQSDETVETLSHEIFQYADLASKPDRNKPATRSPVKVKVNGKPQGNTVRKPLHKPSTKISFQNQNGEQVEINVQLSSGKDEPFDDESGDGGLEVESPYDDELPPPDDIFADDPPDEPDIDVPIFDPEKVEDEGSKEPAISAEYIMDDEKYDGDAKKPSPVDIFNKISMGSTSSTTTTRAPSKITTKYTVSKKSPKPKPKPKPSAASTRKPPSTSTRRPSPSTRRPSTSKPPPTTTRTKRPTPAPQPTVMPRSTTTIPKSYHLIKKVPEKSTTLYTTSKRPRPRSTTTKPSPKPVRISTKKAQLEYDRKRTGGTLKTTKRPKSSKAKPTNPPLNPNPNPHHRTPVKTTLRPKPPSTLTSTSSIQSSEESSESETTVAIPKRRKPAKPLSSTFSTVDTPTSTSATTSTSTSTSSTSTSKTTEAEQISSDLFNSANDSTDSSSSEETEDDNARLSSTTIVTTTRTTTVPTTTRRTTLPPLAMFTKSYMDELNFSIAELHKSAMVSVPVKKTSSKYSVLKNQNRKPVFGSGSSHSSLEGPTFENPSAFLPPSAESGSGESSLFVVPKAGVESDSVNPFKEMEKVSRRTTTTPVPKLFSSSAESSNNSNDGWFEKVGENGNGNDNGNIGGGRKKITYKNPKRPYVVLINNSASASLETFNSKRAPKPQRKRPNVPTIIESSETTSGAYSPTSKSKSKSKTPTQKPIVANPISSKEKVVDKSNSQTTKPKNKKPGGGKPKPLINMETDGEYPYWIPSL